VPHALATSIIVAQLKPLRENRAAARLAGAYEKLREQRSDLIQLTIQGDRHGGSAVDYTINPRVGDSTCLRGPAEKRLAQRGARLASTAGYSGRISKLRLRWAIRSAVSASAGIKARAKMNPR